MGKIIFSLLFLICSTTLSAQNEIHKNAVTNFSLNYNDNDFEKIYQSFSTKMKNARTKKQYFDFLTKVKSENGGLVSLQLINYLEVSKNKFRGKYNGNFENGNLTVKITVNADGQITGLYILKDKTYL